MLKPGNEFIGRFYVSAPATGALTNADALPTGTLLRNGDATAVVVTVANVTTGVYKFSVTIPSSYVAGDLVAVQIDGALSGVSFGGVALSEHIEADFSPSASEIWSSASRTLTQTASEIAATLDGSTITVHRGDTLSLEITNLGFLTSRNKLWFTAKTRGGDPSDSDSLIMLLEYTGTDVDNGLIWIQKAAPTSTLNGSLVVDDANTGDVTLTIEAVETAKLEPTTRAVYDIQIEFDSGTVQTLTSGSLTVTEDVTRATE